MSGTGQSGTPPSTWQDFNRRCSVRIGDQIYKLPVSEMDIRVVPRLSGGPPFVVDISGARRQKFINKQVYIDITLSWNEIGDGDWEDYATFILDLWVADEETQIDFCPSHPFSESIIIENVLVEWDEEIIPMIFNGQCREMPGRLIFRDIEPQNEIPWWILFKIGLAGGCNELTESGGQGTTTNYHFLGFESGTVNIDYQMFSIPDQMDVYHNGELVDTTGGLVSGTGTLSFTYNAETDSPIVIVVVSAPNAGTAWNYTVHCPE